MATTFVDGLDGLLRVVLPVAVLLGLVVSAVVVRRLDGAEGSLGERLRKRFVLGVPWGTLVSVAIVLLTYLLLQDGLANWYDPTTLPYRAWSYLYPLGMATAAFSHNGPGHLLGNLFATLALAPIVEYAWGHFPQERGAESFSSLRTNPLVRAVLVFPGAVLAVGLLTSVLAVGPIIGFSGVVFAFAGFALVHYPITTIVATLGGSEAIGIVYRALQSPILTTTPSPSPPTAPWWAQIAIQGHALGLFLGVVLGVAVLIARGQRPSAVRVWLAAFFFAVSKALWAIYWFRGNETFVLYRGVGVVLVVGLALLVTVAASARDTPFVGGLSQRTTGVTAVLLALAVITGPAILANTVTAENLSAPEGSVEVRDYEVFYAENVENEMVSVVEIDAFGESTSVRTSGVIVVSESRNIWTQQVSKGQLAFAGSRSVDVGGPGWRAQVTAVRRGWSAVGNGTVYNVWLIAPDDSVTHAFASPSQRAEPRIDGRNVTLLAANGSFFVQVSNASDGEVLGTASVPAANESVTVGGLEIVREEGRLVAVSEDTRVRVATRETYRGR